MGWKIWINSVTNNVCMILIFFLYTAQVYFVRKNFQKRSKIAFFSSDFLLTVADHMWKKRRCLTNGNFQHVKKHNYFPECGLHFKIKFILLAEKLFFKKRLLHKYSYLHYIAGEKTNCFLSRQGRNRFCPKIHDELRLSVL